MMITVFMFSFCWQWTDEFYTSNLLGTVAKESLLPSLVSFEPSLLLSDIEQSHRFAYLPAIHNTAGLMIIFPLVILYSFFQRYLVQGIEQSGLAN
jgi:multiple sugar transport system permease protein